MKTIKVQINARPSGIRAAGKNPVYKNFNIAEQSLNIIEDIDIAEKLNVCFLNKYYVNKYKKIYFNNNSLPIRLTHKNDKYDVFVADFKDLNKEHFYCHHNRYYKHSKNYDSILVTYACDETNQSKVELLQHLEKASQSGAKIMRLQAFDKILKSQNIYNINLTTDLIMKYMEMSRSKDEQIRILFCDTIHTIPPQNTNTVNLFRCFCSFRVQEYSYINDISQKFLPKKSIQDVLLDYNKNIDWSAQDAELVRELINSKRFQQFIGIKGFTINLESPSSVKSDNKRNWSL